jgi:hypothetical protein
METAAKIGRSNAKATKGLRADIKFQLREKTAGIMRGISRFNPIYAQDDRTRKFLCQAGPRVDPGARKLYRAWWRE